MQEEIIIDGVNVAGCYYAITPKKQCPEKLMLWAKETSCIACKEHNTRLNFCKNNPNCYYKQLQRLKQENELLKQQNFELIERANAYPKMVILANERLDEIDRLKQENNSLEAELQNITVQSNNEITALKQENKELLKALTRGCYQNLQHECRIWELKESNYRKALEEIREVATLDDVNCTISAETMNVSKDVLKIVNEVLNDNQTN